MEWRRMMVLPRVVRHALIEPTLLIHLLAQVEHPVFAGVELVQESFDLHIVNGGGVRTMKIIAEAMRGGLTSLASLRYILYLKLPAG